MKLSLVLPVYKKEKIASKQILRLYKFLSSRNIDFELIPVIDGIVDKTKENLEELITSERLTRVRLFSYKNNQGKGYAIRYGMRRAKGEIVGFIDADLDIRIKSLEVALDRIMKGDVDVVVPSKYVEGADAQVTFFRKILSVGLMVISRTIVGQPKIVRDISCGLKLFKRSAVRRIVPKLRIKRFAIDTEIFYWVNELKLKVAVVPFYAKIQAGTTSVKFYEIATMIKDIMKLGVVSVLRRAQVYELMKR